MDRHECIHQNEGDENDAYWDTYTQTEDLLRRMDDGEIPVNSDIFELNDTARDQIGLQPR